jgi:hypothetical protein
MTSQQILTLLAPPNTEASDAKAESFLNSQFKSLNDLSELEPLVLKAQQLNAELQTNVRSSRYSIMDI